MAWSIVGVSTVVETVVAGHTLTLPAGTADGDLLVAIISSRIASTTSITLPSGWTLAREHKNNNVLATSSGLPSGMMAYIVRGPSAPALTFTHPAAPNVAVGRIVAYRGGALTGVLDVVAGASTATGVTAVSVAGLTTTQDGDLIVFGACGGQAAAWSSFDAVTDPPTASGATDTTTAPTAGTWIERADATTATGADTSLGIADAIKANSGATGNLTVTASVSAGHVVVAAAFRIAPPAASTIVQTGTTLQFSPALTNTGTVSSTITVPSDADFMLVGWSGTPTGGANFFTNGNMKFPKGAVATNLVAATGLADVGPSWAGPIFYMVAPDTGTNKTLTWDWAGTSAAGDSAKCSITFWKGVDPTNPIRAVTGGIKVTPPGSFGPLNATAGDLVVAFAGMWTGSTLEQSVNSWIGGLSTLTQGTFNVNSDFAWGTCTAPGSISALGVNTVTNTAEFGFTAVALKPLAPPTGTLGTIEGIDVSALLGSVSWLATLAVLETADSSAFTGTVYAAGAIVQTGSTLSFNVNTTSNTGTVSSTITVPSDADFMLVGFSAFNATTGMFTDVAGGATMKFPKGATPTNLTPVPASITMDTGTYWRAPLFYMVAPDTGANKTLTWDWLGTNLMADATNQCSITFWKNVDPTNPIRASTYGQSGSNPPYNSVGSLAAVADDQIVCYAAGFSGSEGATTWTGGLTDIYQATRNASSDFAWSGLVATGTISAGGIGVADNPGWDDGSCVIVALRPLSAPTGTLATTEAIDASAFTGSVSWIATLSTTEAPDVAAFVGTVRWVATLATTEAADTAAFTGTVTWTGILAATEAPDIGSFLGTTSWIVTLAATEAADSAVFNGTVLASVTGTLATTEGIDVVSFAGPIPIDGTLATPEAPDLAAFTGSIRWIVQLGTTELPDLAAFSGTVRWAAVLAAQEGPDISAFSVTSRWLANLAASEAPDTTVFMGTVGVVLPVYSQAVLIV